MSVLLSDIRSGVATQISGITGYNESKFPPEFFARQQNTLAHKSYSVGIPVTEDAGERQRRATYYFRSVIEVKVAYRLRPLDVYPVDYDNALDAEKEVIERVLRSYTTINNEIQLRFARVTREIPDSMEFLISTIEFNTLSTL